jgi:hypothetical protein
MFTLSFGLKDTAIAAGTSMCGTDTHLMPLPPSYDPFFVARSLKDIPRSILIDRIEACSASAVNTSHAPLVSRHCLACTPAVP